MTKKEENRTHYAQELRKVLEDQNMTQAKLADMMGKSVASVNHYATGTRLASPSFVNQANAALGVPDEVGQKLVIAAAADHGFKIKLPEGW